MIYEWTPDRIRFMKEASEMTGYYREIALKAADLYGQGRTVLDMGCGLGYLSLELSRCFRKVISCDISEDALAVLRDNIARYGIDNIDTVCLDGNCFVPGEHVDIIFFCYFGSDEEIESIFENSEATYAVIVRKNYMKHRFSVSGGSLDMNQYLTSLTYFSNRGMVTKNTEISPEFGQPFRDLDDARRFFEIYSKDGDDVTDEFLLSRLERKDSGDYRFYLRQERESGIIFIEKRGKSS